MSNPIRILSISDDDGLRISRELLLLNNGCEAESVTSNSALAIAQARLFDIALICRSVEMARAIAITERLRRSNPEIQILCIGGLEREPARYKADLEIMSGPGPLLDAVGAIRDRSYAAPKA